MKITLKKIAQEAGVSQSTVSRLVNQNTSVSPDLEKKIQQAARKLGVELPIKYVNRMKDSDSPKVVGFLVADLSNPYFQEVMQGVLNEARLLNFGVQIFETKEDVRSEEEVFHNIGHFHLDGLILCASRISESRLIEFHKKSQMPMVLVNRYVKDPTICCIIIDYEKALYQAASHLLNLGHRRIAYLSGPSNSDASKIRRAGIVKALHQYELEISPELCPSSFPNIEGGFQSMMSLLALPEEIRPTAVLAYNDLIAVGALRAIRIKGLRVPEDISVIGIDNIDLTVHTYPPITTIAPPKVHMGSMAMRTIYRMNTGEYEPSDGYIELEAPLTLRYSTGPMSSSKPAEPGGAS